MKVDLNRINALAKKKKETGLTEVETKEQAELRQAYLAEIKGQVLNTVSGLKIMDEQGNDVTPKKIKDQRNKQKHASTIINNKFPRI